MERRGRTEAWPPGGLWTPTVVAPEKSLETETDADAWLARRGRPGTKELTENPGPGTARRDYSGGAKASEEPGLGCHGLVSDKEVTGSSQRTGPH